MVPIAYRERERIFGVMTPPARTFVQADWRSRESATEVRLNATVRRSGGSLGEAPTKQQRLLRE